MYGRYPWHFKLFCLLSSLLLRTMLSILLPYLSHNDFYEVQYVYCWCLNIVCWFNEYYIVVKCWIDVEKGYEINVGSDMEWHLCFINVCDLLMIFITMFKGRVLDFTVMMLINVWQNSSNSFTSHNIGFAFHILHFKV